MGQAGADMAVAVQEAATALQRAARRHKRAEAASRRASREAMEALAQLRAVCEAHGIRLVLVAPGGRDDDD